MVAGEGPEFDDPGDEAGGPPPDPDDRLWRHPSEIAKAWAGGTRHRPAPRGPGLQLGRLAGVALVAAVAGALLSAAILYAMDRGPLTTATTGSQAPLADPPPGSAQAQGAPPAVQVGRAVKSGLSQDLRGVVAIDVTAAVGDRRGTGFVYQANGMILTSARLVSGATTITVTGQGGAEWSATVLGSDPSTDLAMIQVPAKGLHALPIAASDPPRAGDLLVSVAVGGQDDTPARVSVVQVKGVGQRVTLDHRPFSDAMETDSPPPDPLGGVLLDGDGEVVGLIQAALPSGDSRSMAVATPAEDLQLAATQLAAGGPLVHGWLGVSGTNLSPGRARALGIRGGALITKVVPDSPAAQAGLVVGDVITKVDHHPVTSMTALSEAVALLRPGTVVPVEVDHRHHRLTVKVTLAGQPS